MLVQKDIWAGVKSTNKMVSSKNLAFGCLLNQVKFFIQSVNQSVSHPNQSVKNGISVKLTCFSFIPPYSMYAV